MAEYIVESMWQQNLRHGFTGFLFLSFAIAIILGIMYVKRSKSLPNRKIATLIQIITLLIPTVFLSIDFYLAFLDGTLIHIFTSINVYKDMLFVYIIIIAVHVAIWFKAIRKIPTAQLMTCESSKQKSLHRK